MCGKAGVCVCVYVCLFVPAGVYCMWQMHLREHHFKTNSPQRKQSPLDRHKVSMSKIRTTKKKKKKVFLCYESDAPVVR